MTTDVSTPATTTLVTMFFNLKELEDASSETRSFSFYEPYCKHTLAIEAPLVLFCDSSTKPWLETLRNSLVDVALYPTVYIEKELKDYTFYQTYLPIITEHRRNNPMYINHRNTPSYYLLTMFKVNILKIVQERNDFQTSHYTWIDIGCSHAAPTRFQECAKELIKNPKPKIGVCSIHYRSSEELAPMKDYVSRQPCGVAAGVITAEASYIPAFHDHMWSIFHEMLELRVGHSEETCLTYCVNRWPEMFSVYYGDYYSLLTNYHYVSRDYETIKRVYIENVLQAKRYTLVKTVATYILDSVRLKHLAISDHEVAWLQSLTSLPTLGVVVLWLSNQSSELTRCLDSIEAQTVKPDSVVVLGRSSFDTVGKTPYSFQVRHLVCETQDKNRAHYKNYAASQIHTTLLSFFDSHDEMHPQRLEYIRNSFIEYPRTSIVLHSFLENEETIQPFFLHNGPIVQVNQLRRAPSGCAIVEGSPTSRIHHSQCSVEKSLLSRINFREDKEYEGRENAVFCGDILSMSDIRSVYIQNPLSKYHSVNS